jgi:hypothetical protein
MYMCLPIYSIKYARIGRDMYHSDDYPHTCTENKLVMRSVTVVVSIALLNICKAFYK